MELRRLSSWSNTHLTQMFRKGLGRVDWPKYWSYAHRIREVHITDEAGSRSAAVQINPLALLHASSAATSHPGRSTLLPRVRALAFAFHHPSDPLIGPTVRRIIIKIPQPAQQIIQAASIAFSTLISMPGNLRLEQFDVTIGDGSTPRRRGYRPTLKRPLTSTSPDL